MSTTKKNFNSENYIFFQTIFKKNIRPNIREPAKRFTKQTKGDNFFFFFYLSTLSTKFLIIFLEHFRVLLNQVAKMRCLRHTIKIPYWNFWVHKSNFFRIKIILLLWSNSLQNAQKLIQANFYKCWRRLTEIKKWKTEVKTDVLIFVSNLYDFFSFNKNASEIEENGSLLLNVTFSLSTKIFRNREK